MSTAAIDLEKIDEIFTSGNYSTLSELEYDWFEGMRLINYLVGLANIELVPTQRELIYSICYRICVKLGALSRACEFAMLINKKQYLDELIRICIDIDYIPNDLQDSLLIRDYRWTPIVHVNYKIENEALKQEEKEIRNTMLKQLLYQISQGAEQYTLNSFNLENREDASILDKIIRYENQKKIIDYVANEIVLNEPKGITNIFKLQNNSTTLCADSATNAMLQCYGSAFVHTGYGKDTILTAPETDFVQRCKNLGITSSIAGIGLVCAWDFDKAVSQLDCYQYSNDSFIRAGAALGFGLSQIQTNNALNSTFNLVAESLNANSTEEKIASALALGLSYAGTHKDELAHNLIPIIVDQDSSSVLRCNTIAALSLGLIFIGTCDVNATDAIVQLILDYSGIGITSVHLFNASIGLGLLYMMRQHDCDSVIEVLGAIEHPIGRLTIEIVRLFAYSCANDTLRLQEFIEDCITHSRLIIDLEEEYQEKLKQEEEKKENKNVNSTSTKQKEEINSNEINEMYETRPTNTKETEKENVEAQTREKLSDKYPVDQVGDEFIQIFCAINVLSIFACNMRDNIGQEMLLRLVSHLLQYDNTFVRRAVPLGIALVYASNPNPIVLNILNRLTHNNDGDTAINSIVAIGVVCFGTNNAKGVSILKNLAAYYEKDSTAIIAIRLAQSFIHFGKGLYVIGNCNVEKTYANPIKIGSLIAFLINVLMHIHTICDQNNHLLIYLISLCIEPRWLVCLNSNDEFVPVSVKVGQYIDTAGQPGTPRSIAGYHTLDTPIIICHEETVELNTAEYQSFSHYLTNVAYVRKTDAAKIKEATKYMDNI